MIEEVSRREKYKATYQAYYQKNRERILELGRIYRREHGNEINERRRRFRLENPERVKEWSKNCKKNPQKHQFQSQKWKKNNPEKVRVHMLMVHHPDRYPLDNHCIFCERVEGLEHAHLDYEDEGFNYVTACHQCNSWMERG